MKENILIIGDLHLGNRKNDIRFLSIARNYSEWIKNICKQKHIKTIIQLGDVFHNRENIHSSTIQCAYDFFNNLKQFQIHIVLGNHDCVYNNSSDVNSLKLLKNWPNITVHEKVTSINGLCFCGWGTKLEDIPENQKAIFGHFDVKGFEMNAFKISEHGFTASSLMEKCQILFSGHYHKPQVRFYDKKPLVYSGSAYQLNWGESGEKKYVYVFDSSSLKYEMIENEICPKFVKIKDLTDENKIKNNFVSIEIEKTEDLPQIESKLKHLKCLDFVTTLKQQNQPSQQNHNDDSSSQACSFYDCVDEYVKNLTISDDKKLIVAERLKKMYDVVV